MKQTIAYIGAGAIIGSFMRGCDDGAMDRVLWTQVLFGASFVLWWAFSTNLKSP